MILAADIAEAIAAVARSWATSGSDLPLIIRKSNGGAVCVSAISQARLNQTEFARELAMSVTTFKLKVRGVIAPEPSTDGRWDAETVANVRSMLRLSEKSPKRARR